MRTAEGVFRSRESKDVAVFCKKLQMVIKERDGNEAAALVWKSIQDSVQRGRYLDGDGLRGVVAALVKQYIPDQEKQWEGIMHNIKLRLTGVAGVAKSRVEGASKPALASSGAVAAAVRAAAGEVTTAAEVIMGMKRATEGDQHAGAGDEFPNAHKFLMGEGSAMKKRK